jgi:GAF domain-containing protein
MRPTTLEQPPHEVIAPENDAEVLAYRALAKLRPPPNRWRLDDALEELAEVSRRLTDARYGAVTVTDSNNHVEGFFVAGLNAKELRKLKTPPQGHGPLGVLRDDGRPVRIEDLNDHPLSFGFPPKHPEMTALCGVPIWVRGEVRGSIYVTDKKNTTTFEPRDESILQAIARHAGWLIERFW